jgi:uncharacterized SAM-binding protein YcdF (DUF218 family)
MGPIRTARALVAMVVAAAFLAFTGGVVVEAPSRAAEPASVTSLAAQAIYFQQDRNSARRDLAVSSMAASSAWDAQLWADFVASWSSTNKYMKMNSAVPSGLPKKGHVFVVLGSSLQRSGKVSAKFERRLKLALKALKKYPASNVLVSGGVPKHGKTEGEAGSQWLVAHGVAKSRVLVEKKSSSTIGNAKYAMAILAKSSKYTSYSLISDSSHLRRASILFDAAKVLVQEQSGKSWSIQRAANVAYMDMKKAGQVPLEDWSVSNTAGEVASLFGLTSQYKKLLSKAPAKPVLTSLKVTAPTKLTYVVGEDLSTRGLVVKALYDKGVYSQVVTSSAKVAGFDSSEVGDGMITASYTDGKVTKTSSFAYSVVRAASSVALGLSTKKVKVSHTRVTVKATVATGSSGLAPTGKLRFYLDGKRLKTITLDADDAGAASFRYPKISKTGKHELRVAYAGNDALAASSKRVTVTVSR